MASVTGIRIDEVFADRNYVSGTFPNRNATFIIEVQAWSNNQALNVRLGKPTFVVELSGVPNVILGSDTRGTSTILPGSYLIYNLRFNVNESRDVGTISYSGNNVGLGMTTRLTAGLYSETVTVCNSVTWNWTAATVVRDYGWSFNQCVP